MAASIFDKCGEYTVAADARERGVYPFFKPIERVEGSRVVINGRQLIMAGSNNYLGLATDPRMQEAAQKAIQRYGTSCSGSRLMNGSFTIHEEMERRLAHFVGKETALSFTTGYQTNLGAISALIGKGDYVIADKYNHASIMDGIFMSRGIRKEIHVVRYRNNDMSHLEKEIAKLPQAASKLIVSDGVFSMEGSIVKLPELTAIAKACNAAVYLDEAHALGVLGASGRGTREYYGKFDLADIVMCTFSKSFGSIGGFVAGDGEVIDYIRHFARPLIFSASLPPANVAAVMTAMDIMEEEPDRFSRLHVIAERMIAGFKKMGFDTGNAETPIVPLIIGDNEKTFVFWKRMFERGVYVNPVIPPAVPPNRSLIRTSYMAIHSDEDLNTILEVAGEEGRKLGIIS